MSRIVLNDVYANWHYRSSVSGHDSSRGVTLTCHSGEWIAVVGDNGVGKSTLLHAIAGTVRFTSGLIQVDGKTMRPNDLRARFWAGVSFVPQEAHLPLKLSMMEIKELILRCRPGLRNERGIQDLFDKLRSWRVINGPLIDSRVVDFVGAVLSHARVVLLDEIRPAWPKGAKYDPYAALKCLLPDAAVFVVDHNRRKAVDVADHVLWLRQDGSMPAYFAANSAEVQCVIQAGVEVETNEQDAGSSWELVRLDQTPGSQLDLASRVLANRSAGKSDRRTAVESLSEVHKNFPFLSQEKPTEVLSGGQKVVLLGCIVAMTGLGQVEQSEIEHLDQSNREKLEALWKKWSIP